MSSPLNLCCGQRRDPKHGYLHSKAVDSLGQASLEGPSSWTDPGGQEPACTENIDFAIVDLCPDFAVSAMPLSTRALPDQDDT